MENSHEQAFPSTDPGEPNSNRFPHGTEPKYYSGLTKREYFAGLAMQGLLSLYDNSNALVPNQENISHMVILSAFAADELLKQLNK